MWCDCVLFVHWDWHFVFHTTCTNDMGVYFGNNWHVCDYLNDQASEEKSILYLLIWLTEK